MLTKDQFFAKYSITDEHLEKAGVTWDLIGDIYASYFTSFTEKWWNADVLEPMLHFFETFTGSDIHFVRARVKDPERVVLKLINLAQEMTAAGKPVSINKENYFEFVKDIIGVRLIYLFSSDWIKIHERVLQKYGKRIQGVPIAYVGLDDPKDFKEIFESYGCKVESNSMDARLIEYDLKLPDSSGNLFPVEIQARTIFEEAATEVSTALQYPRRDYSVLVDNNLSLLRNLANQANKVASYTSYLRSKLESDFRKVQGLKDDLALFQINRAEAELDKFQTFTQLEDIQKLINSAKTDLAIDKLYVYIQEMKTDNSGVELIDDLNLISSRYNFLKDHLAKGLIPYKDSEIIFNQISSNLMALIKQLNASSTEK